MTRAKQLALDALKCPVRHALKGMFESARLRAWDTINNVNCFVPMMAVKQMRKELTYLCQLNIINSWELEVTEATNTEYRVELRVVYKANGVRRTTVEHWRIW